MSKPTILNKEPVGLTEVKTHLSTIQKQIGELNFRAGKTQDYINDFAVLDKKKFSELKKKLEELEVPRLKEDHIVKIIDLLPGTTEEVKLLFQNSAITINNDNIKKIAQTVSDYVPDKK